jgi:hypothetical protein
MLPPGYAVGRSVCDRDAIRRRVPPERIESSQLTRIDEHDPRPPFVADKNRFDQASGQPPLIGADACRSAITVLGELFSGVFTESVCRRRESSHSCHVFASTIKLALIPAATLQA